MPENGYIKRYKRIYDNPTDLQLKFAEDMFNLIVNDEDKSRVTVIPAPCGIGKTMTIKALINYCVINNVNTWRYKNAVGLVIITDQLKRLEEYQYVKKDTKKKNEDWGEFDYASLQHEQFCTYITSKHKTKSSSELLLESEYQPIVLLSTQRYFALSEHQRERLFTYRITDKNKKTDNYARRIVIFDEKPYFYSTKTIQFSNINDVLSALQEGIPSTDKNKAWVIEQYENFRLKIEKVLLDKEIISNSNEDIFYWNDKNSLYLTSNDERFFEIIDSYKSAITRVKQLAYADLLDFKRLINEGAFFITTKKIKGQDYQTRFELFTNNKEKFYINKNKAKFFVFDATADVDPDYHVSYINMINTEQYHRQIPLTIKQFNVNTSKSQMTTSKQDMNTIKAIKQDISERFGTDDKQLIATYMKIKKQFENKNNINISVVHFGNIKGINDFRTVHKMAHVGLNRNHHFDYFIIWLSKNPMVYELLRHMDEEKSRKFISDKTKQIKGLFETGEMNQIMFSSLLADFEQNIHRIAIREFTNTEPVEVLAYWDNEIFASLNELIEERYSPYGAKIEYYETPLLIAKAKVENRITYDGERTIPQRIIEWFDNQPKGRIFKVSELLIELNITNKQFQKAKNNKCISDLLSKNHTGQRGLYKVA